MGYVIEERRRDRASSRTMALNQVPVTLPKHLAELAADKLRVYFGMKYEYEVIEDPCCGSEVKE